MKEIKKRFPKYYNFKFYTRKKRQDELVNIARIIENSFDLNDFKLKLKAITLRDIKMIHSRINGQSVDANWYYYRKGL